MKKIKVQWQPITLEVKVRFSKKSDFGFPFFFGERSMVFKEKIVKNA